jgi:hypothetical protein
MSVALTSDGFHIASWLYVGAQIEWPATGLPVGAFKFQGSQDSTTGADERWRDIAARSRRNPPRLRTGH